MQLLPWWPGWGEGMLVYIGALLVWSLALYVLTRGTGRVAVLAVLAMGAFAMYLVGLAIGALAFPAEPGRWVAWLRGTWWGATLAPSFWVGAVLALGAEEGSGPLRQHLRRHWLRWSVVSVAAGVLFALLGAATELVLVWRDAVPTIAPLSFGEDPIAWHIPTGPLFSAYQVYLVVSLGGVVAVLAWLYHASPAGTPLRARFTGLLASAILFLGGGVYISVASGGFGLSALLGEVLLISGVLVMGWNIARYGALVSGEMVAADFRAFCVSTSAVIALYGGLLLLVPRSSGWPEGERFLLLIVLTTHALADDSSALLDRIVFDPVAGSLRARLRSLADRVVRRPDTATALVDVREGVSEFIRAQGDGEPRASVPPVSGSPVVSVNGDGLTRDGPASQPVSSEFRIAVEGALRHLNDVPSLSQHPLLGRTPATVGSRGAALEDAALLRSDLLQALERLRPSGSRPTPSGSAGPGGWLHYLVLHEAYVEGRPNKQIMQRYYLSESTFHRARRRAVDTVALDLHQRVARGTARQPA